MPQLRTLQLAAVHAASFVLLALVAANLSQDHARPRPTAPAPHARQATMRAEARLPTASARGQESTAASLEEVAVSPADAPRSTIDWGTEREGYRVDLESGIDACVLEALEAIGRDPIRDAALDPVLREALARSAGLLVEAFFPSARAQEDVRLISRDLAACRGRLRDDLAHYLAPEEARACVELLDRSGWFRLDERLLQAGRRMRG